MQGAAALFRPEPTGGQKPGQAAPARAGHRQGNDVRRVGEHELCCRDQPHGFINREGGAAAEYLWGAAGRWGSSAGPRPAAPAPGGQCRGIPHGRARCPPPSFRPQRQKRRSPSVQRAGGVFLRVGGPGEEGEVRKAGEFGKHAPHDIPLLFSCGVLLDCGAAPRASAVPRPTAAGHFNARPAGGRALLQASHGSAAGCARSGSIAAGRIGQGAGSKGETHDQDHRPAHRHCPRPAERAALTPTARGRSARCRTAAATPAATA